MSRATRKWALSSAIAAGLLAVAAISAALMLRSPQYILVSASHDQDIEIRNPQPGEVQFFAYPTDGGAQIRFLLARDTSGQTKAGFDACQRCYLHNEGYGRCGGGVICRYCGNRYKLESKKWGFDYCAPMMLPIKVTGQTVHIRTADLDQGRGLF